jgi:hypothetical protein
MSSIVSPCSSFSSSSISAKKRSGDELVEEETMKRAKNDPPQTIYFFTFKARAEKEFAKFGLQICSTVKLLPCGRGRFS